MTRFDISTATNKPNRLPTGPTNKMVDSQRLSTTRKPHSMAVSNRWSPDSKAITFPMGKDGLEQIISHPLVVGPPKVLFEANPDDLGPFAWSPDGRRLYYTSGPVSSNVVMFNLE